MGRPHALGGRWALSADPTQWACGDRVPAGRAGGHRARRYDARGARGLPGAARADRRRGRRVVPAGSCRPSTSPPTSCSSGCCRPCCTPRRSRPPSSTSTPTVVRSCCSAVGLVVFTTVGVGWLVHRCCRTSTGRAALAIGAVVAPPDAVAATAIGRRIGLPRRIVTILEGESLLQRRHRPGRAEHGDRRGRRQRRARARRRGLRGRRRRWCAGRASRCSSWSAKVRKHVTDPVLDTAISLRDAVRRLRRPGRLGSELHASGVVAVVVAGLLLGHKAPILQTAQSRIAERINWRTIAVPAGERRLPADRPAGPTDPHATSATATSPGAGSCWSAA